MLKLVLAGPVGKGSRKRYILTVSVNPFPLGAFPDAGFRLSTISYYRERINAQITLLSTNEMVGFVTA